MLILLYQRIDRVFSSVRPIHLFHRYMDCGFNDLNSYTSFSLLLTVVLVLLANKNAIIGILWYSMLV